MSEHDPELPPPGNPHPPLIEHEPDAPAAITPPTNVRRRGGTPLLLTLLLASGLGGGIYWTWTHPLSGLALASGASQPALASGDPQPAIDAARAQLAGQIQTLTQQVQGVTARVDTIEKQPAAASPGLSPDVLASLSKRLDDLTARVDGLSAKQDSEAAEIQKNAEIVAQRSPQAPTATPPDNTAAQVPGLVAGQQAADIAEKLHAGLATQKSQADRAIADQKTATDQALAQQKSAADQALAEQKSTVDALEQRLGKLEQGSGQVQAAQQAQTEAGARLAALDTRVGKLEQDAGQVQGVARDADRAIRLASVAAALQAGQPIGDLPGAPPALARYATAAPPTEAGLRAAWPLVAEAARAASQPDLSQRSFLDRALARVQQSVTVRRGDHVLVGDPASGVLAKAQAAVDAGDLKGAADTLGALRGQAAAAAQDWVAQVRALLDARAALATMAHS